MRAQQIPYNFISIEGNIGAGKTTFCQLLQQDYNCRLVLEQFTDNPFLPYFYENPERFAFQVELFFMTERHKQMQLIFAKQDMFQTFTVSDYFFLKTLLFAKNNLNDEEYRLFQRLFHILNAHFPKPDLLVYLHRNVEFLLQNIAKRGRDYEQDISEAYLSSLQKTYFDYFKTEQNIPIVIVDLKDFDFCANPVYYKQLLTILQSNTYKKGINYMSLEGVIANG